MRILLACVLAAVTAEAAEPSAKKPWQWTDEERLAERFDPISAQYRFAVAKTDGWHIPESDSDSIVVDGDRNPELILPHELMYSLVGGAYSDDPATRKKWREKWSAGAQGIFGEHFWAHFENVAGTYIEAERDNYRFHAARYVSDEERSRLDNRAAAAKRILCPSRTQALAKARELFGREQFDRFLYQVVAPGMRFRSSPPSKPESGAGIWMWMEGGCGEFARRLSGGRT